MLLTRNLPAPHTPAPSQGGVVTLGNFDGVHLGHQALLNAMRTCADDTGCTTHVISFEPHPRNYFAKLGFGSPISQISSVRQRIECLRGSKISHLHLLRFNQAMAQLNPQRFVERALVQACNARHVFVGKDVRFGHQRAGDLNLLRQLGSVHGFAVHVIDDYLGHTAKRISSTAVRQALAAGELANAKQLLGRDASISGRVIHGRKLGRTLGCPTLNLNPNMANPALKGICVVAIDGLPNTTGSRHGVASLGLRPTIEQTHRYSLEVHVFDWAGDAYGHRVNIRFLHKLRDEAAYVNLPTLQLAIEKDMADARQWLAQNLTK